MPLASRAASFKPAYADVAEQGHHAGDGADEAEQRRDADDDFEHDQAAFEPDDFMARGGLQRVHIVRLRPVEVVGGQQEQASERRRFPAADVRSALWCRRGTGRPSTPRQYPAARPCSSATPARARR